jgi:hypothetical protein
MHLSRSIWFSSFWILLLRLVSTFSAFGQSPSLHGRVTDETGALIPGATVTVALQLNPGLLHLKGGRSSSLSSSGI